jgi:ribosome assembly protein YihI (activator of Der GTPase)
MPEINDAEISSLEEKNRTIESLLEALDAKVEMLTEQARQGNMDQQEFDNAEYIAKFAQDLIDGSLQRIDELLGEPL